MKTLHAYPQLYISLLLLMTSLSHAVIYTADPLASSGDPNFYQTLVNNLSPGDTLRLPAGTYKHEPNKRGLSLVGLSGTPNAWITIGGPESGPPAVITAITDQHNNVQMGNNAYLDLKNLTIDSSDIGGVDGINTDKGVTHDISIENCTFVRVSGGVAINTKDVAWNWVIRNNIILGASTGMYIGNPNGTAQFIC
jgi:hypothetical protein